MPLLHQWRTPNTCFITMCCVFHSRDANNNHRFTSFTPYSHVLVWPWLHWPHTSLWFPGLAHSSQVQHLISINRHCARDPVSKQTGWWAVSKHSTFVFSPHQLDSSLGLIVQRFRSLKGRHQTHHCAMKRLVCCSASSKLSKNTEQCIS